MHNQMAFAKSSNFWRRLAWGTLVALLSVVGTLIFVILMNLGLGFVWGWLQLADMEAFSGTWQIVAIMTAGGFLVGLIHHYTNAEEAKVLIDNSGLEVHSAITLEEAAEKVKELVV